MTTPGSSDFLAAARKERERKRGGLALVLFFASKKVIMLALGGAVVAGATVAVVKPDFLRRILSRADGSANPFSGAVLRAADEKALKVAASTVPLRGQDASGESGPESVTGGLPSPASIMGLLDHQDARRMTSAVRVDQPAALGQVAGGAAGGTGLENEPVAAGALAGKSGTKVPGTYDTTTLGIDQTARAQGANQGKTFMAHGQVSRNVLRAFLSNNAKLKVQTGDDITVEKGGSSPIYQLAEAKVSTNYFRKSATNEGKAMVGAVYDGHKVDKNVITAASDPPPVKGDEIPDVGCKGIETGDDADMVALRANCMGFLPKSVECNNTKAAAQAQLSMMMRKLTDVGNLLDQECDPVASALCPVDCVPCQKNSSFRTNLCNAAIGPEIAVANQDCSKHSGIPPECQKFFACSADSGSMAVITHQPAACTLSQHCTAKHKATDPDCFGKTQGGGTANQIQTILDHPAPNPPTNTPANPPGGP